MKKKIGIVWLRDDFRSSNNLALAKASKNHDEVVALYLFKKKKFLNQEAQQWWVYKSLKNFRKKLIFFNINLQIVKVESYKNFFDKISSKSDFSI